MIPFKEIYTLIAKSRGCHGWVEEACWGCGNIFQKKKTFELRVVGGNVVSSTKRKDSERRVLMSKSMKV